MNDMKKLILLPFALLIVFGCYRPHWYRPDTTYAQLNEDSNFCWNSLKLGASKEEKISEYEKCMKEKGYQLPGRKPEQATRATPALTSGDEEWVWIYVPYDFRYYHHRPCPTMSTTITGRTMKVQDAIKQGYKPCPYCIK